MTEFWTRVADEYHHMLPHHVTQVQPMRSLQTRWKTISAAVGKYRGCVRQIENLNPSGASETDILTRAKELLCQDPNYSKGFKFDHVWTILKDMEKFCETKKDPSQRKRNNQSPDFEFQKLNKSFGSSSVCVDLNDEFENMDDYGGTSTETRQRPNGIKKEKNKKVQVEEMKNLFMSSNQNMKKMFEKNTSLLEKSLQLQAKKIEARERREENKFLCKDINSISDPTIREYFQSEQKKIWEKRAQQEKNEVGFDSSGDYTPHFDLGENVADGMGGNLDES